MDKGYISLDTLKKYNTKQVEAILYNLLFWKKGQFEYRDAKLNLTGMIVTQLNPMKLILEASRRIDELSVLQEFIPSDKLVFRMSGKVQSKEEIKLNANEWRILSLIDGTRTVRQIINESGYDEFAVYKIFFSVISSGLIEQKEEANLGSTAGDNDFSAILTVFNDILAAVKNNIVNELGDRSYALFEEVKPKQSIEYRDMFKAYHPDSQKNANLQSFAESLDNMELMEEPNEFFINGFTEYCLLVLRQVGDILGKHPLSKSLEDINNVLGYVTKYQAGSSEKNKIVNDMKNIIARVSSEFKLDKKAGGKKGLFSFLS